MKKPSEMLSLSFWCGFAAHLSFLGMYQDFIGKAAYLSKVNTDWMDTSPYMWMAFFVIAILVHQNQRSKVE